MQYGDRLPMMDFWKKSRKEKTMKKTILIIIGMAFTSGAILAATPTPSPTVIPTPSPTPVRVEVGDNDYRVPIGSTVMYGSTDPNSQTGTLIRIKVDSTGRIVISP